MIILDTNVISEAMQPRPAEAVIRWLRFAPGEELFTTAITEAEMRYGGGNRPKAKRRELEEIVGRIFAVRFAGRILPFDSQAAKAFPRILVDMQRDSRSHSRGDAQIAAIAVSVGAVVATRDIEDFERAGVEIINPWTA
ncbi:MAG TPA: type II toxin-antitoxin system VapC family toxin [Rhizomicrobium sp.]|nr:type II toxin-antitoxin system VapC family toxin [Rhizomicrobium sp.]